MKLILLAILACAFLVLLVVIVIRVYVKSHINETQSGPNYTVRFNPMNNKYYIVDARPTRDKEFRNFWGLRKYYTDRTQAEVVLQKMKGNFV